MSKRERAYLEHISECLLLIEEFTSGGRATFLKDKKTRGAVLYYLQTLAESTKRLSNDLKEKYPDIDWHGMAGFRNVLIHEYLGVKPERVWDVIEKDLPKLKSVIDELLERTTD